mmetsp:Transcript_2635/g.9576  ORF Transcript_2635/g.9576 Transcript_2635/m.9576 type:complete len:206 (+) Transcript_2635:203-820(+)
MRFVASLAHESMSCMSLATAKTRPVRSSSSWSRSASRRSRPNSAVTAAALESASHTLYRTPPGLSAFAWSMARTRCAHSESRTSRSGRISRSTRRSLLFSLRGVPKPFSGVKRLPAWENRTRLHGVVARGLLHCADARCGGAQRCMDAASASESSSVRPTSNESVLSPPRRTGAPPLCASPSSTSSPMEDLLDRLDQLLSMLDDL